MSDFQKFIDENLSKVRIENAEDTGPRTDYDIYGEIRYMIINERRRQKMSQERLAGLTGISQATISSIERGISRPCIDSLRKIAEALGKRLSITFEDREDF